MAFRILSVALLLGNTLAAPLAKQAIAVLSKAQISSFKPYTYYASIGYCQPAQTLAWSCANCKANPTFKPTASGGNGRSIQYWYVGYDPTLKTVIVGHQGTDPTKIQADLTDLNFSFRKLSPKLFTSMAAGVKVHGGFAREHAKTAAPILAAVQKTIAKYKVNKVTVVGHSLGAALALIDGVYLPLAIPKIQVNVVGYGMPRVGNKAFADYVDRTLKVTHINNKNDLVPIVPGRQLGFTHPNGELHIQKDLSWAVCPGHDNTDKHCTVGSVPNILKGKISDHTGPYDGVNMKC